MRIVVAGLAVLAAVTFAIAAAAAGGEPPQKKKPPSTKDLYETHCQVCHGVDGRSPVAGMSFVGREWKTKTAAEAVKVITGGVPGTAMLPFEGKLDKGEIAALARYVRALDSPAARRK